MAAKSKKQTATETPAIVPADENVVEKNETAAAAQLPQMIPIGKLCRSSLNVRTTEFDADIPSLAESIAAKGLKQNLAVVPAHFSTAIVADGDKPDWNDLYEVVAGGRRFQAIRLLAETGRIAGDYAVPCIVEDREAGRETSLDENLHKVTMNPADEFAAYRHIVETAICWHGDDELAIRECAKRFGKTLKHVKERLRLAGIAPDILQALREDKIGFESAKAYATIDDHELQLAVFALHNKETWRGHHPRNIRDDLRGRSAAIDDPRMIYIGLDAYLAEGGRTKVEMFMGEGGQERALDVALLAKLTKAKAEAGIPARAKEDGLKDGLFAAGIGTGASFPKPPKGYERHYQYYESKAPAKSALKKWFGVYCISAEGTLVRQGYFKPESKRSDSGYKPETPEERAARERVDGVALLAARLAVGKFADSPFEGRAFWPGRQWWAAVEDGDDHMLVAVQVRVSTADIEEHREAAAKQYDEQLAAKHAEEAARADQDAAGAADDVDEEGEDDGGEFGPEDVEEAETVE